MHSTIFHPANTTSENNQIIYVFFFLAAFTFYMFFCLRFFVHGKGDQDDIILSQANESSPGEMKTKYNTFSNDDYFAPSESSKTVVALPCTTTLPNQEWWGRRDANLNTL